MYSMYSFVIPPYFYTVTDLDVVRLYRATPNGASLLWEKDGVSRFSVSATTQELVYIRQGKCYIEANQERGKVLKRIPCAADTVIATSPPLFVLEKDWFFIFPLSPVRLPDGFYEEVLFPLDVYQVVQENYVWARSNRHCVKGNQYCWGWGPCSYALLCTDKAIRVVHHCCYFGWGDSAPILMFVAGTQETAHTNGTLFDVFVLDSGESLCPVATVWIDKRWGDGPISCAFSQETLSFAVGIVSTIGSAATIYQNGVPMWVVRPSSLAGVYAEGDCIYLFFLRLARESIVEVGYHLWHIQDGYQWTEIITCQGTDWTTDARCKEWDCWCKNVKKSRGVPEDSSYIDAAICSLSSPQALLDLPRSPFSAFPPIVTWKWGAQYNRR